MVVLLAVNGNIGLTPSITQDRSLQKLCSLGCDDFIRKGRGGRGNERERYSMGEQ